MFEQLFDSFRKASEATLQAQQDLFRQWTQKWPIASFTNSNGSSSEWSEVQKQWLDSTTEALNKHREALDSTYRSGIQLIEQSFGVSEARSPEDYRRMVEELWRKLSDTVKTQSETQFSGFRKATEKWIEMAQNTTQKQSQVWNANRSQNQNASD